MILTWESNALCFDVECSLLRAMPPTLAPPKCSSPSRTIPTWAPTLGVLELFVACLSLVCRLFVACLSLVCRLFVACLSLACRSCTHVLNIIVDNPFGIVTSGMDVVDRLYSGCELHLFYFHPFSIKVMETWLPSVAVPLTLPACRTKALRFCAPNFPWSTTSTLARACLSPPPCPRKQAEWLDLAALLHLRHCRSAAPISVGLELALLVLVMIDV